MDRKMLKLTPEQEKEHQERFKKFLGLDRDIEDCPCCHGSGRIYLDNMKSAPRYDNNGFGGRTLNTDRISND